MSTSTLNIWITNLGEPCTIANDPTIVNDPPGLQPPQQPLAPWVVAVSHCDGRVLNWSEGRYRHHHEDKWRPILKHTPPGEPPGEKEGWWYDSIPTRDGHVEIEVPPGCYIVRATMHSWFVNGVLYGNWATERVIIQASCGKDICATLYAPSAIACSVPLFEFVIPLLIKNQIINREKAKVAIDAMKAIFNPESASSYEKEEFETLRRAFRNMDTKIEEQIESKEET